MVQCCFLNMTVQFRDLNVGGSVFQSIQPKCDRLYLKRSILGTRTCSFISFTRSGLELRLKGLWGISNNDFFSSELWPCLKVRSQDLHNQS